MGVDITLSEDERLAGVAVAARRKMTSDARRRAGRASRQPEHYVEIPTWDQEIECACAEMVVCSYRNVYWTGARFDGTAGTDASGRQVRWTEHADGHLILYREDADDQKFMLVTGRSPTMTVVGWVYGHEGKIDANWREDVKCPSWWVPQSKLRAIE